MKCAPVRSCLSTHYPIFTASALLIQAWQITQTHQLVSQSTLPCVPQVQRRFSSWAYSNLKMKFGGNLLQMLKNQIRNLRLYSPFTNGACRQLEIHDDVWPASPWSFWNAKDSKCFSKPRLQNCQVSSHLNERLMWKTPAAFATLRNPATASLPFT